MACYGDKASLLYDYFNIGLLKMGYKAGAEFNGLTRG
jgi:hypothetical protein